MVMHYDGMQDGALVRDQATRIAELEEALHVTLDEREEEMTRDEQAEAQLARALEENKRVRKDYDIVTAQLAEAKAELASNKLVIDQLAHERNDTQAALEEATACAERAEAELKDMRRVAGQALDALTINPITQSEISWLRSAQKRAVEILRAALAPSPAGREG